MSLQSGTTLAHYKILEPIGKGGMGEVYRALDTKLGRDVAIKVLPQEFSEDAERLARFKREAKVLASLNHPNIASIYGLEQSRQTNYLVLELVPGETLADRIARGPIPIEEALEIATKIAEALEEAHEHGVVHRDLKPANIKLTPDDKVKVLDFGLAKPFVEETEEVDSSLSPTLTRDATRVGVILGTAAYMSPEQAKGKQVDKRTDIFAFGAVLYEMLTGKKAFPGDDVSEVLASVIKLEPDWTALPAETSPAVRRLLKRCLEKDAKWRIRDIGDVRLRIADAENETERPRPSFEARPLAIAALILLAVALPTAFWPRTSPVELTPIRFELAPNGVLRTFSSSSLSISPDGRRIAYLTNAADTPTGSSDVAFAQRGRLFLHNLDELESKPVPGSDNANKAFFSPDSQWLAFFKGGKLEKIHVTGGASVTVCDAPAAYGGTWGADGTIVFAQDTRGLFRVSADGGTPELLIAPREAERTYRWPRYLPSGDVLFTAIDADEELSVSVWSASTGESKELVQGGTDGRYLESGHLAYIRERALYAAPFDLDRLVMTGLPKPVVEDVSAVTLVAGSAAHLDVSATGVLVYLHGETDVFELAMVDRDGGVSPVVEERTRYQQPRFSPTGNRLTFIKPFAGRGSYDVWIHDMARRATSRLTLDPDYDITPTWSPDETYIAFASRRDTQRFNLFRRRADGSGDAERLTETSTGQFLGDWSPDGKTLAFTEQDIDSDTLNISVLDLEGERSVKRILGTDFNESDPSFSPDGRFLAYMSDESGRYEVYVQPYPDLGAKEQVSTDGGLYPVFSPNGRELFYQIRARDGGVRFMVADYTIQAGRFTAESPREFAQGPFSAGPRSDYDISRDGKRLLVLRSEETRATPITVVVNWFEELQELVPPDN